MLEKIFKLKQNNTTVKTEVVAGVTTFMTMAYIIALNPNLLTGFAVGTPLWNAVFLATVISAGVGTLIMAFYANQPFVLAPGMGLNSYFATVVASVAGCTIYENYEGYVEGFQSALSIILISGVLFTVLTVFRVREKIVDAIPKAVRLGIPAGIGFMLVNVGLTTNAGVYNSEGNAYYMLTNFFGDGPSATKEALGDQYPVMVLYVVTMFIGIFVMAVLGYRKVKGSILIGMIVSSVTYWISQFVILGNNPFASLEGASFVPPFKDMLDTTFLKFDFSGLFKIGTFSAIMTIVSFQWYQTYPPYRTKQSS